MKRWLLLSVVFARIAGVSAGQDAKPPSDAEGAIRQGVAAYVKAFNAGDSKALADQWSPDAVYINRRTGEEVTGRKAIAEQFDALFKEQKGLRLDVSIESIRFLSPNVAVEQGTARFLLPPTEPEEFEYTAVYVQQDGKWLLDRVTDESEEVMPSHYEQLKALEWMVGRWIDQDDQARIETECNWAKNQNFLVRSFTIAVNDRIDTSGMQIIGWDAATKSIRSWTFDSAGGFAEATWKHKDGKWFVSNKGVLADGRSATMVNVIKPVDENSFTWQTIERTVGGELLPNVGEVQIVRQ